MYRGRFAPSPTGPLHLGGACTALCAWLAARSQGGTLILRVEDLDAPRVIKGAAEKILDELRWLGLDWDEGPDVSGACQPYIQSQRTDRYNEALEFLSREHHTYHCDCSRAEIARLASAPHAGEEGPLYPGTCRNLPSNRAFKRPPAVRLRVPEGEVSFTDLVHGEQLCDVQKETGDFVLRRGDGVHSYQLAVVVDDIAMGITEVVRGADLLSSTARQIVLARLLGAEPPRYAHAPLVIGSDGERLAKRARGVPLFHHREAGRDPRRIVAALARLLGLADAGEELLSPGQLIERFDWKRVPKEPVVLNQALLGMWS